MLVLLADTRKNLLWLWLGFTAFIILLIFVQTLTGKFEGVEFIAWLWAFINLLPALTLLLIAVLLNKNASKVVLKTIFQAIFWACLVYLTFVLMTLVGLPIATLNWSIEAYLGKSYQWLIPFQLILIVVFWLLYFKKEALFRPNPQILQEYISKKAEFAGRTKKITQQQAYDLLIADDKMPDLFEFLKTEFEKIPGRNNEKNDILLLQSQYVNWQRNKDLNLAEADDLQRELNRITLAVINVIEKL